ncbi:MAG: BamA/TamA family outer membrane protein [Salibacteraceae bacterium]
MCRFLLSVILLISIPGYSQSDTTVAKKEKKVGWAAVPSPSYNQVQGWGITVVGGVFYQLSQKDTISNPSSTFVYGTFAENGTWIGAFLQEGYFAQNKWWYDILAVKGDFRFRYYHTIGSKELQIDYATDITIVKGNFLRKINNGFYGGLHYKYSRFNTVFNLGNLPNGIELPQYSTTAQYAGIGFKAAFDNRDYTLNPKTGMFADITTTQFRKWLGSDSDFDLIEINFNHYHPINKKQVLASRFYGFFGIGDVPFEEQAILGFAGPRGNDVRGYSSGRYRGENLIDIQGEWRYNFYKKWGMVAFGSLSLVGNDGDDIKSNGLLPAIGTGLRYMASVDKKVNVGLDVAAGKDDYGVYFIISEAF